MTIPGSVRMADVSEKPRSVRTATARAEVYASPAALSAIREGRMAKGDALSVAKLAGIAAAKQTPQLLPLCHPVQLTHVDVAIDLASDHIEIHATAKATDRTGVEMEALVAATVAALTIYDMAKPMDPGIEIRRIVLVKKAGGKSGTWVRSDVQ